jgi:LPXTG-site transpeptidase (sortase) family protein
MIHKKLPNQILFGTFPCLVVIILLVSIFFDNPVGQAAGLAQMLPPYPVTVTIDSVTPNPAYVDQAVTVSVSVSASAPAIPTGTVELRIGDNTACLIMLDAMGKGDCTLTYDMPAEISLKAIYPGNTSFLPGVSEEVVLRVIDRYRTEVSILSDLPDPSFLTEPVLVTAQIAYEGSLPAGNILIYRNEGACTVPVTPPVDSCSAGIDTDGQASCSIAFSTPGITSICASYPGDVGHDPYLSDGEPHQVASGNTTVKITKVDPARAVLDQSAWVYYEVRALQGVPTGTVTIRDGSGQCSASVSAGRCQFTFTVLDQIQILASYSGGQDGQTTFDPAQSMPVDLWVDAPPEKITSDTKEISANVKTGAKIATLSTVDLNKVDTFTYSLVSGEGSKDNAYFSIEGSNLLLAMSIASRSGSLSIRVQVTDSGGLTYEQILTFTIVQENILPETGFPAGRTTVPSPRPPEKAYTSSDGVILEIPTLGVQAEVVGVPLSEDGWDTTWLWEQVGWLDGTAFPSWSGNSGIAGHNILSNGRPGPFYGIDQLEKGDEIWIRAFGDVYVFSVRNVSLVGPGQIDSLEHKDQPWLTLITCQSYDESAQSYRQRVIVQAVLTDVR